MKSAENQDCRTADSRRGSSNTSLGSQPQGHQVITSQHRRPQSTVMVTKNEVPGNHPERVWGIAQVLAVNIHPKLETCYPQLGFEPSWSQDKPCWVLWPFWCQAPFYLLYLRSLKKTIPKKIDQTMTKSHSHGQSLAQYFYFRLPNNTTQFKARQSNRTKQK